MPCPRPSRDIVLERLTAFRRILRTKLPPTTPATLDEFPAMYTGRKRIVYQRAVDSLKNIPVRKRDAWLKWFIKYEKLDATVKGDPAPRIISPRDPRYNVMVGLWLKPAEHKLFKGIARVWKSPTVAKGLNALGVGNMIAKKWQKFSKPVAVGLDASRFDQHTSYEMLRYFEHLVYKDWFRDPEFNELISWQLENIGVGRTPDGFAKANVTGCRMSGDMNTSSGNCLIMCALVWAYAQDRGVKCELVNNGDDCVVIFDSRSLHKFSTGLHEWFLELGYNMKVEDPVFEIEKIEFCQAHPVHVGEGQYIMVRNIMAVLAKDSMALIKADHPLSLASWCAEVGRGGTACYGGIPILDTFYRYYERQGDPNPKWSKSYQKRGFDYLAAGMNRRGLPITYETRFSFFIAFGILPAEQEAVESYFAQLPDIPHIIPLNPVDLPPKINPIINHLITGN